MATNNLRSRVLKGTFPAVPTPMMEDGNRSRHAINEIAFQNLIYHLLDNGCEGVVLAGCTGHAVSFRPAEQIGIIKVGSSIVSEYNRLRGTSKLTIGGDGGPGTDETIGFAQKVEDAGVYYHLMISPSTNKPPQRGIEEHYREIANKVNGSIIMYSVPGRTGGDGILPETAARLAEHPRILGIKEASGKMERVTDTIRNTRGLDFVVLSGDDALNIDIIEAGGTGTISVAANVEPRKTSDSVRYALAGNWEDARRINGELKELYGALFASPSGNPVMAHYALRKLGFDVGVPRLPLVDATPENMRQMDDALGGLGWLKKR